MVVKLNSKEIADQSVIKRSAVYTVTLEEKSVSMIKSSLKRSSYLLMTSLIFKGNRRTYWGCGRITDPVSGIVQAFYHIVKAAIHDIIVLPRRCN